MRLLFLVFLAAQLLLTSSLFAQNTDSFSTAADSATAKALQHRKKEFEHWQDSVQASRIKKEVERNGKPLDVFLQEMKERERVQRRQTYIRIGAGILFFTVLVINFLRRRKKGR